MLMVSICVGVGDKENPPSPPPSARGHFRFKAAHMLLQCRTDGECEVDIEGKVAPRLER